jgi:ubiquinone/menaquinone biosynthesis C-methylase UbiE
MSSPVGNGSKAWSDGATHYKHIAHVPNYFAEVAADLIMQTPTAAMEPISFLDIAAGAGSLSSAVMTRLSAEQKQTATFEITDFSAGMIEVAESSIRGNTAFCEISKHFQVMNGQDLKFADNTFSHVGCQFGVMFFPEPAKGYSEMVRVLKKNGTAVIGTWNYVDNAPLLLGFSEFLNLPDIAGLEAFMKSIVSVGSNPSTFREELLTAGFTHVVLHEVSHVFTFDNDEITFNAYATNAAMKKLMGGDSAIENFSKWQEYLRTTGSKWLNGEGRLTLQFVANVSVAVN